MFAELRTFTDTKGKTIRASLIGLQGDEVTLRLENGQLHTFKATFLSPTDIEYLKTKGLVFPNVPAPVVEPPKPVAVPAPSASTTYGGYEMFMLIDKQRRVVSVMFRDNGKDIQWFPKPDGIREPYYNMFSELTYNGSTTQEVPYQILGAGSGVTCIKTALRKKIIALPNMPNMAQMAPSSGGTKENVHWYLPAPFARSILDIVEVYRQAGVIK